MKAIWKYEVRPDEFTVEMPNGAQVLTVQIQGESVQMWALVDPDAERVQRTFVTYGTGHPIMNASELVYIGTFQPRPLVFHLFERVEELF